MEVFGKFLDIVGVGKVISEGMGVERNGHGVNRSRYCSKRDRRETIRPGGGRPPACFRSSRQRARSIVNNRRREG